VTSSDDRPKDGRESEFAPWWSRLPIALLISVAFFIGAYRIAVADNGLDGIVLMVVAVILVGVWITIELHDRFYGEHQRDVCPDPSAHKEENPK